MTVAVVIRDDGIPSSSSENEKFTFEVFKIAALSAIGGFLFGYDTGIVSGAMIFIKDDLVLDEFWQELVVSITIFSAWIFSSFSGHFSDKYGRRKVIIGASIIFTLGSILMAFAWDEWMLLFGRFVVGAAIGIASMVVPIYIVELAPSSVRGSLVTTNTLFITFGQASAAIIAGGFSYLPEHLGWRFMLGVAAVPAIIQFIGFLFMPESPRWLIAQKKDFEAMQVLQRIRGPDACIDKEFNEIKSFCKRQEEIIEEPTPSTVNTLYSYPSTSSNTSNNSTEDAIKKQKVVDKEKKFSYIIKRVWGDKYLRKALIVGAALQAVQQLTGINTVMYYSATIIQMSGVHDKTLAVWFASITAMVNFLTSFIGLYLVEKIGRRLLTLGSLAGVILSLVILGIGFQVGSNSTPAISFRSTDPFMNSSYASECFSYDTCNGCIASAHCGYCVEESSMSTPFPNGTCLPAFMTKPESGSTIGSCAAKNQAPNTVWAYNFCPSPNSWLILLGLCLYLLAFGPGMGPMPWTINSEIYPNWARGVCYSVITSTNWFFNGLISLTFLSLATALTKQGAFWLYSMFGLAGFIFFFFNLPETKGQNLEETSSLFGPSNRPVRLSRNKLQTPIGSRRSSISSYTQNIRENNNLTLNAGKKESFDNPAFVADVP